MKNGKNRTKKAQKLLKSFKKQDKGITLIALVVTIVVLIILALIGLNAVFGDNGLIKRAEYSKGSAQNMAVTEKDREDQFFTDNHFVADNGLGLDIIQKVLSTPAADDKYRVGEEITYEITVINTGEKGLVDIMLEDTLIKPNGTTGRLTGLPGGTANIGDLNVGESTTVTYIHRVGEDDVGGELKNEVDIIATSAENPEDYIEGISYITVLTESVQPDLEVRKEVLSTPANGTQYGPGEEVAYKVTVTNIGKVAVKDIVIRDVLTAGSGEYVQEFTQFDNTEGNTLQPNQVGLVMYTYVVKQEDLGQPLKNVATVSGNVPTSGEKIPDEVAEIEEPTEDRLAQLDLEKTVTSSPSDGVAYKIGETINYTIEVTNTGNLALKDILIVDTLFPYANAAPDGLADGRILLDRLEPGQSKIYTYGYYVQEIDILNGSVINEVTAYGKPVDEDPSRPEEYPEVTKTVETEVEKPNGHITLRKEITSTPVNGINYALGETITYRITAINDGNVTITEGVIIDEVTGLEEPFEDLAVGDSLPFETMYTVAEADVLEGKVINVVKGQATCPDPEKPEATVKPGKAEAPVEGKNAHLSIAVHITSTPANGESYTMGETIRYVITVTNDGNLTVTDIDVGASLSANEDQIIANIPSLSVGKSQVIPFEYVVTDADIAAGNVHLEVFAIAPNPDPIPSPTNPDDPWVLEPRASVDAPASQLRLTVNYWYDRVGGTAAASSYTNLYSYGQAYNVASPRIAGYEANIWNARGTITADTVIDVVYMRKSFTLTVQYRYMDGTVAAPDAVVNNLGYGDAYNVASPVIWGYSANQTSVSGVMPEGNVVQIVYYMAAPSIVP